MTNLLPVVTTSKILYGLSAQLFLYILTLILYKQSFQPACLIVDNILILVQNVRNNYTKQEKCDQLLFFIFTFILTANLAGAVGFGPILSYPIVTVVFVIISFVLLLIQAVRTSDLTTVLKSFAPKNIPKAILPALYTLELASFLIKPVVFSVRLVLNSSIGHLLLHIIEDIIPNAIIQQFLLSFIKIFELATSILQANIIIDIIAYLYGHLIH